MNKKEKIIYLIVSIFVVLVVGILLFVINLNTTKSSGTIHLYITGHNDEVIFDDDIAFYEGDFLIDVLNRCVDVKMGNGNLEGMIVNINGHDASNVWENYFKLVVNCEYAMYGATILTLNDEDEVRITYSSNEDWEPGC